jgi:predicted DNA-binding WGR domain protein
MALRRRRSALRRRSVNTLPQEKAETWYLTNTRGAHNKFYEIKIEKQGTQWALLTRYGRIERSGGKTSVRQRNNYHPAIHQKALKLVEEKVGRGYELQTEEQKAAAQVDDFDDRFSSLE